MSDVKSIFGRALECRSTEERSLYLNEACAGDTALRGEVEELLAAADQAGSFLNKPAADPNMFTPTVLSPSIAERAGSVIGPYKLLQQIGEGGFGVVYMAEQERPVRRMVALKIIKPGMDTREVIARFEAERQALAMMDHQNIARVLDAGATDTGRPYFVMELVKGVPITEYCNTNKLTPRERLELFVPVCHAIQHAHQKGIIHRDIKPSNVLACLYDGKPVPKVIDFGVAKAIEQRLTEKTMFTRHDQVIGTLEYMSPEQAELSQLDIDTRSDIYSLGVLLYELLTGTTPITKEQLRQAGFTEMLRLIREAEPERPSLRLSHSHATLATISAQRRTEPAKLGALLKGELDWLVMKALEKDRTRRYETANGLARDIERYLHDEPVEACPPSFAYRMSKVLRRHRRSVIAGSLLTVFLAVVAANHLASYFALKKARALAWEESNRARAAEAEALDNLEKSRQQQQRAEGAEQQAEEERDRAVIAERHASEQRDRAISAEKQAQAERDKAVAAIAALEPALRQAVEERARASAAHEQTQIALARSQFEQARAIRLSGQPGWRWAALNLLKQSAAIRSRTRTDGAAESVAPSDLPSLAELRTEALSALLTGDGRLAVQLPGYVHSVSPDGKFAASLVIDRNFKGMSVTITDLVTGKTAREWKGKEAEPMVGVTIALGPNADRLAVLSANMKDVKIWQLSDRKLLQTLPLANVTSPRVQPAGADRKFADAVIAELIRKGAEEYARQNQQPAPPAGAIRNVRQLAFSPDGHSLAAVATRDTAEVAVVLWRPEESDTGRVLAEARGLPITATAFSPDSRRLAFAADIKKVIIWDIAENRAATEIELPTRTPCAVGFQPGGNTLAIFCPEPESKSRLVLWDIEQNRETARVDVNMLATVSPICFTPDGDRVAMAGASGETLIVDVPPSPQYGERPPLRIDHGAFPQLLAWTASGHLVTGGLSGLKQWELASPDVVVRQRLHAEEKTSATFSRIAFSPDGRMLAAAPSHGGKVDLFDRTSGKQLRSCRDGAGFETVFDIRFSPDSKQLVRFGMNGVVVWDASSGEETMRMTSGDVGLSTTLTIGFKADGGLLAGGMKGARASIRDVTTGNALWTPESNQPAVAAVSPNGRFGLSYRAFAVEGDLAIPVWDLEAAKMKFQLPAPQGMAYQSLVEISPDSRWILAMHYGNGITKSFPRGMPEARQAIDAQVSAGTFVPPNPVRYTFGGSVANIITPDQAWTADVWNADTGERQFQISAPSSAEYIAFSPDGRYLAISLRNQTIRFWDVDAKQELFDWRVTTGPNELPFSLRHLAFTPDSTQIAVPDPDQPAFQLLDLDQLRGQLSTVSLAW